jgi:hypothetical protein
MTPEEFQVHVIDTLARLDTKMETLVGNGQPGRVGRLEEQLEALKRARWTMGGIVVGAATVLSAIIHFIFKY